MSDNMNFDEFDIDKIGFGPEEGEGEEGKIAPKSQDEEMDTEPEKGDTERDVDLELGGDLQEGTGEGELQEPPPDLEEVRLMAILSYITILVLIPLFTKREHPYVRFHVKQGLVLLLFEVVASIVYLPIACILGIAGTTLLPCVPWILLLVIAVVLLLVFLIYSIIGVINAWNGKYEPLPLIGSLADELMKFVDRM